MDLMGKVFDTRKHSNIKKKAEYRRIGKYIKSRAKDKEERIRRQVVLDRWMNNVSVGEIAKELGQSKSTVRRDLAKLKPTIERRQRRLFREFADKERVEVSRQMQGLTSVEQARWIVNFLSKRESLQSKRQSTHRLAVVVDADAAKRGQNALKLKPQFPALIEPYTIYFFLALEGKRFSIGQISVD